MYVGCVVVSGCVSVLAVVLGLGERGLRTVVELVSRCVDKREVDGGGRIVLGKDKKLYSVRRVVQFYTTKKNYIHVSKIEHRKS